MIFDVKDYGAVGDGVTDDSSAVQTALDAAQGVGRVVFPAGTYLIEEDPIVPSCSNIRGYNAVIMVTRQGAAAGLAVNPDTDNVFISGIEFRGPWYGVDTSTYEGGGNLTDWYDNHAENTAIDIRGRWYQREVLEYTSSQMNALTDESRYITVKDCTIEGFGQSGILVDQVSTFLAERNRIYRNGRDGIRLYGVVDGIIDGNTIGDMFAAYADGEAPNFNMYGVAVTRLYGKPGYEDPDLTIGRPSQDIRVSSNFVWGLHTWKGLDTHGGVSVQFINNVIQDCNIGVGLDKGGYTTTHGIAPARDIIVSGNVFRQTDKSRYMRAAITAYGHDMNDDQLFDGLVISGNSFRDWGGGNTDSCISVSNATGVSITGNRFLRPSLSAIRTAGRVQNFTVNSNTIANPRGHCTFTITNGGSGYTSTPEVTVTGGGGTGMRLRARINGGQVESLKLLHPGWGYTEAPTITITGGGGSGASATATFHAPYGIQTSSRTSGIIDGNTFSGDAPYESVRLSNLVEGYEVKIGEDNVYSNLVIPPSPGNIASGSHKSSSHAWANIGLTNSNAFIRAEYGVQSVTRQAKGVVRIFLRNPLRQQITSSITANVLAVTGYTSATVVAPNAVEISVTDAWGAPLDASLYVAVFAY